MNKKIILGLGLCLLLTVINLHRAMDNYGITDAKFKVGVLADESSSSGTSYGGYHIDDFTVVITVSFIELEDLEDIPFLDPNEIPIINQLSLYDLNIEPLDNVPYYRVCDEEVTFRLDGGKRICTEGGLYNCVEQDLGNPTANDLICTSTESLFIDVIDASFSVQYLNY